jgi:nicotinate phosphoribosyltransferase
LVSGGLDETEISELADLVDGFGVGTCLSNARVIDYAMDIVEVDGEPRAKRGKMSGEKKLVRCTKCHSDFVIPAASPATRKCECGGRTVNLLHGYIKAGKVVRAPLAPEQIRRRVLKELKWLEV